MKSIPKVPYEFYLFSECNNTCVCVLVACATLLRHKTSHLKTLLLKALKKKKKLWGKDWGRKKNNLKNFIILTSNNNKVLQVIVAYAT